MEFQHVNVKLFVKNSEEVDLEALIPVFHGWIQNQASGELLLDVADYRHVRSGPGVVLIGHQGNYSLDNTGGRLGVRYNRKAPLEGTNQDRLVQATQAALAACQRLETEPRLGGNDSVQWPRDGGVHKRSPSGPQYAGDPRRRGFGIPRFIFDIVWGQRIRGVVLAGPPQLVFCSRANFSGI